VNSVSSVAKASLRRITAVGRKEFLHVLRDPRSLALGILMPLIMLFLFGYALTLDVDRVPLAVWDQSQTPQSRELISRFEGHATSRCVSMSPRTSSLSRQLTGGMP
jgi:ABC-2 type transport system permease protein